MREKILLLFLVASVFATAQDSSFQLKDYKYRTPGFKALGLDVGLSGNYSESSGSNLQKSGVASWNYGPFQAAYTGIRSTDQLLRQTTVTLGGAGSKTKSTGQNAFLQNRGGFNGRLNATTVNRNYRNRQWFFETGNELAAETSSNVDDFISGYYSKKVDQAADNKLVFGVGKGRIEWVRDAQMALFVLNDLRSQGLIRPDYSAEEVNRFAQVITDINNRRIFDSRRRRIYELTRIDSFLRASGLATQTDVRHFATVNDNWAFTINPFRSAGSLWYLRLRPGARYSRQLNNRSKTAENKSVSENFALTFTPEAGYEKAVPVNLKWQHNLGLSGSYQFARNNFSFTLYDSTGSSNSKNQNWEHIATGYGYYGLGFYPNNRTQLTATASVEVNYLGYATNWVINPQLRLATDYFLGYRTYLSALATATYTKRNYRNFSIAYGPEKELQTGFSIRFTHFLF